MSAEYKAKQAALIAETVKKQDIIITTALIPGRAAPVLVTEEMVKTMRPGSVIIDLAVESGGNCPLSKPDQVVARQEERRVGKEGGSLSRSRWSLYHEKKKTKNKDERKIIIYREK